MSEKVLSTVYGLNSSRQVWTSSISSFRLLLTLAHFSLRFHFHNKLSAVVNMSTLERRFKSQVPRTFSFEIGFYFFGSPFY